MKTHSRLSRTSITVAFVALLLPLLSQAPAEAATFLYGADRSWSVTAQAPGGGAPVAGGPMEVIVTMTWDAPMHSYVGPSCTLKGSTSDPRTPSMYFAASGASPSSHYYGACGEAHALSEDFLTATWTYTVTAPSTPGTYTVVAYSRGSTYFDDSYNFSYSSSSSYSVDPAVPSAPTSVTASALGDDVTIGWTAPSTVGTGITGYTATASPGGATCTTTGATTCSINDLTYGQAYTFVVSATNAAGTGPDSSPSSAVTPSPLPTAPQGVGTTAADGAVTVSWSAPAFVGSPALTSYTVTASPGGETCTTGTTSCQVTSLTNGTEHTFTVVATNTVGDGAASSGATETPYGAPGQVTDLTAVAGDTEVAVSWTAPADTGGFPITAYTVTASPGGATCATAGTTTCTVTGLTNGIEYSFAVASTNSKGATSTPASSVTATPSGIPAAPTGLTAVPKDGAAYLSWTAPTDDGGSAITGYTATASPGGAGCTTTSTSCTVSGLANTTEYTFVVAAENANGSSPNSTSVTTTPQSAPEEPTSISAAAGDGETTVSWTAPSGPVTSYTAVATPGGADCSTTGTSCTITGLTNGTDYVVAVRASNAYGTGPWSDGETVIPASVPGAPSAVTADAGDTTATVSWTAPDNGGSAITAYNVTASPGGATCSTASTHCVVTGLTNGTAYTFTVVATNARGDGPASNASPAATPSSLPGAPAAPTVSPGDGEITVRWTAPPSGGSAITGYAATAAPGGANCTATELTCVISGLTNGTAYTVTVAAVNANGTGPDSAPSESATPEAAVVEAPPEPEVAANTTRPASGGTITVTGEGFVPDSEIQLWLYPGGTLLRTTSAEAGGDFTATITLPAEAVGSYEVRVLGMSATGPVTESVALAIQAVLPNTGIEVSHLMALGALLLLLGAATVVATDGRKPR